MLSEQRPHSRALPDKHPNDDDPNQYQAWTGTWSSLPRDSAEEHASTERRLYLYYPIT